MIVNALREDKLPEQQFVEVVLCVVYKTDVDVRNDFDVVDMNIHYVDNVVCAVNIVIVLNMCVGNTLNAVNSVLKQTCLAPPQMVVFPMKVHLQQLGFGIHSNQIFDIVDMDTVKLAGNNVKGKLRHYKLYYVVGQLFHACKDKSLSVNQDRNFPLLQN
jgi:hypothetical protein